MSSSANSFDQIFNESLKGEAFWEEMAILSFTNGVLARLEALGMSRKDLAAILDVSPAYITKLIGGTNNFTLKTMVKVAKALKCELNIELQAAVAPKIEEFLEMCQQPCSAANDYEDLALAA